MDRNALETLFDLMGEILSAAVGKPATVELGTTTEGRPFALAHAPGPGPFRHEFAIYSDGRMLVQPLEMEDLERESPLAFNRLHAAIADELEARYGFQPETV